MRSLIKLTLALAGFGLAMLAFGNTDTAAARSRIICTMEYAPVCGLRNGVRRTYANRCVARASGATVLHAGACPGPICIFLYAPVCARDMQGARRTYPSLCAASNANAVFLYNGQCRRR